MVACHAALLNADMHHRFLHRTDSVPGHLGSLDAKHVPVTLITGGKGLHAIVCITTDAWHLMCMQTARRAAVARLQL